MIGYMNYWFQPFECLYTPDDTMLEWKEVREVHPWDVREIRTAEEQQEVLAENIANLQEEQRRFREALSGSDKIKAVYAYDSNVKQTLAVGDYVQTKYNDLGFVIDIDDETFTIGKRNLTIEKFQHHRLSVVCQYARVGIYG